MDGNKGKVRDRSNKEVEEWKIMLDEGSFKKVTRKVQKTGQNDLGNAFFTSLMK